MTKLTSWNINRNQEAYRHLLDSGADVAMLQEAIEPPKDIAERFRIDPGPWKTAGDGLKRPWRAALAVLNSDIEVHWLEAKTVECAPPRELAVSRMGTLAAAILTPPSGKPFIVASMYAPWENFHRSVSDREIYADASAHRIISDLSLLIFKGYGHPIIAAGDLNILYGYGEHGSKYWAARYETVFSRMSALGVPFVGPKHPNGRQATPWPKELPSASLNVPTYYSTRQKPETATRQLDFVFASENIKERVKVRALNEVGEWGPSDHCRLDIVFE